MQREWQAALAAALKRVPADVKSATVKRLVGNLLAIRDRNAKLALHRTRQPDIGTVEAHDTHCAEAKP